MPLNREKSSRVLGRWVRSRLGVVAIAATVGVLSAGLATAVAVAAETSPTITTCVSKLTGSMRVVSNTNSCFQLLEKPLTWDQFGSPGPTGAPGSDGSQGQQGPAGPAGAQGADGAVNPPQVVRATFESSDSFFPSAFGTVQCPEGLHISGGGARIFHPNFGSAFGAVTWSEPVMAQTDSTGVATSWRAKGVVSLAELAEYDLDGEDVQFELVVFAICV